MARAATEVGSGGDLALGLGLAVLGPLTRLVHFAARNRDAMADLDSWARVVLVSVLVAVGVTVLVSWSGRVPARVAGAGVGVVGFLFFSADSLGASALLRPVVWCVLCALTVLGVADLARRRWVALVLLTALSVTVVWFGRGAIGGGHAIAASELAAADPSGPGGGRRPDVYLFVVDAFERPDELSRQLGSDLGEVVDQLAARGFEIDPRATANYQETLLSVPSLLEQRLVVTTESDPSDLRGIDRRPIVAGANRTVRQLMARGYRYVQADPGITDQIRCAPDLAIACIEPGSTRRGPVLDEVGAALWGATPLGPLLEGSSVEVGGAADPRRVIEVLDGLRPELGDAPLFLYAHILAPHPPFRLEAECARRGDVTGGLAGAWTADLIDDYVAQARCTAHQLVEATDRILARDPDALIVVVGDHGSGFGVPFGDLPEWNVDALYQRFSVLRALRMPPGCGSSDPRASSTVNTFRLVVACLDGTRPDLVEPRAFMTRYGSDRIDELPRAILEPR